MNRQFTEDQLQIEQTHEKMLESTSRQEMHITLAMSCHFILIKLAKRKTNTDCWLRRGGKKRILSNITGGSVRTFCVVVKLSNNIS